jgi:hypothetical protein
MRLQNDKGENRLGDNALKWLPPHGQKEGQCLSETVTLEDVWTQQEISTAIDAASVALWRWNVDSNNLKWTPKASACGVFPGLTNFNSNISPRKYTPLTGTELGQPL